jgi:hypothetical protein
VEKIEAKLVKGMDDEKNLRRWKRTANKALLFVSAVLLVIAALLFLFDV